MRVEAGKNLLGIEGEVAWATPGSFTVHNFPCHEDGKNCDFHKGPTVMTQHYVDPSQDMEKLQAHLEMIRVATISSNEKKATTEKRYFRTESS